MNKKNLRQLIISGAVTGATISLILQYETIKRWFPWSNPNIMNVINVTTKKDLSASATKLNKLIDAVKKDEAQTDVSVERANRITKNRQEISKIFLEMADILELDLANIIRKEASLSGSSKDLIESFRSSSKAALKLNSYLSKFEV